MSEGLRDELMDGPPGVAFGVSVLVFMVGVILFGISLLRGRRYSRLASWLFVVGFLLVPLGEVFGEWVAVVGSVIAGIAVFWLSWSVWSGANRSSAGLADTRGMAPA